MKRGGNTTRLRLGPIVGHTTDTSSCVWIQADGNPSDYKLRVKGKGVYPFLPTEAQAEFGTAVAKIESLRPDRQYEYSVLHRNRVVFASSGSFRTMPPPGSVAEISFVVVSCSGQDEIGVWPLLEEYVKTAQPRFLLMLGDQVYMDDSQPTPNVWTEHLNSKPAVRRKAMAIKYEENWSRKSARNVLANIPTYMLWDDHEIRDGWGSLASDSPSLAAKPEFGRGKKIHEKFLRYYSDARDVYGHFQVSHNPPPYGVPWAAEPFQPASFEAMPFAFQCGKTLILMVDSRGGRDPWRESSPILTDTQWAYIDHIFNTLPDYIEVIVMATQVPIASQSPSGYSQDLIGYHTEDVDYFRMGQEDQIQRLLFDFPDQSTCDILGELLHGSGVGARLRKAGLPNNLGELMLSELDDARDQWSNHFARPEQEKLIRKAAEATYLNRPHGNPRKLIFLGGDLHVGGMFEITVDKPQSVFPCLVASGIGKKATDYQIGTIVDRDFEVCRGIRAKMSDVVGDFNFGAVTIFPTAQQAEIFPEIVHKENAEAKGITLDFESNLLTEIIYAAACSW